MHSIATVLKNVHGDFEVIVKGKRVKSGYFTRHEDYAYTEALRLARELNNLNK